MLELQGGIICICLLRRVSILSSHINTRESSFSIEDSEKNQINFLLLFPALVAMIDSTALAPKTDIFVQTCGVSALFDIWIDQSIFPCTDNLQDGGI